MPTPWAGGATCTCVASGFSTATYLQVYRGRDKSPVKESLTDVSGSEDPFNQQTAAVQRLCNEEFSVCIRFVSSKE